MLSDETAATEIIVCSEEQTLSGLFRCRVDRTPHGVAYRQFDRVEGVWRQYTWQQTAEMVRKWRLALAGEGLLPGDRVALQVNNSLEWVCFDQAAHSLGLVVVPLYTTDSPENAAYILADAAARLLLLDNAAQWLDLQPFCADSVSLVRIICIAPDDTDLPAGLVRISSLLEWLASGSAGQAPEEWRAGPHDLATIIYTSGTTGRPKGVMLSHRNILWNVAALQQTIPCRPDDLFLSFLPLSHTFERTVGYYLPVMAGASVAYARSIQELAEDLLFIRPTVLVSVPRIFERVYAKVQHKLAEEGRLPALLFSWTVAIGWRRFEEGQGRGRTAWWQNLLWPLLRRLVADKILARLGGRLRVAVSGGAPLFETISRCFIGLGLPLLQGYGLTEASPVVSTNIPEHNIPGSVGPPLPGVEIRIGANHELQVRAPSVMLGYWQNPQASRQALDEGGWLHTGDQAAVRDGHIFICGRIKDVLVLSTGEKVPPAEMEMVITQDPLFDMAMIVGEGKPYLVALLVLNAEKWPVLATALALAADDPAALASAQARGAVAEKVDTLLHQFPGHARVRQVVLQLEPWTVENGLLTPTLKLKRLALEKRFAREINQLYAHHDIPR
jgi:long-chain acyl-CoA synthetase